jgi:CheY-like chemotaxis protein
MTHNSGEGQIIDSLQVLVIAERVVADRIHLRFGGKGMDIKVQSPPMEGRDLVWLIQLLFPDTQIDDPKGLGEECSLFAWSRFDVVILSDIWWADTGESRVRCAAGRVFALWDNNRGNFATRKIVLVTDADDFESMAQNALNESGGTLKDSDDSAATLPGDVERMLDPKRSISFVDAGRDDFLKQLEASIYSTTKLSSTTAVEDARRPDGARLAAAAEILTRQVIRRASIALRSSIQSTQILVIDDEQSALEAIYNTLTDKFLPAIEKRSSELTVKLLDVKTAQTVFVRSFDELDSVSKRETKSAIERLSPKREKKNDLRDVVVVTDILFEIGDSTRTGIDIIRSLRKTLKNRIGIIAFTSFTTPFIAMAAYRQGADYVIQKDGLGGRHESLRLNGFDRLVEALAILSFQRSYLRRVRKYCVDLVENLADNDELPQEMLRLIRLFERTVPQQTVSLHMQQEWEDTYWLLKTVQTGNIAKPEQVKIMLSEFGKRY